MSTNGQCKSVKQVQLILLKLALLLCLLQVVIPCSIAFFTECKTALEIVVDTSACPHPLPAPFAESIVVVVCHVYFPFLFKYFW
jgi:hypothetical protein